LVVAGLVVAFGSFAQTTISSAASATFPCGQTTLGPNFAGGNIEAVIGRVNASASAAPRSEFETTAQYYQRIESASEQLVFLIPKDAAEVRYDADANTTTVGLWMGGRDKFDESEATQFSAF
jgi:hypothetical protein